MLMKHVYNNPASIYLLKVNNETLNKMWIHQNDAIGVDKNIPHDFPQQTIP